MLGSVLGQDNCFGAVTGEVAAGPMTFFRASSGDRAGTIKAHVGEGEFTDDPFGADGGVALTKIARPRQLLGFVARNAIERHVATVRGSHAGAAQGAATRHLNRPVHRHATEADA